MSSLLEASRLRVEGFESVVGFERGGPEINPAFDRYLTIEGKRAYHVGNGCGTCEFLFRRLDGANQKVSPSELSDRLRAGLPGLDADLVTSASRVLPAADYRVTLLRLTPRLLRPGAPGDYFVEEQVELWGINPFWALPHDPRTEYYRTDAPPLGEGRELFEFLVPLVPSSWLHADTVTRYEQRLAAGGRPTALALTVLDVKQPAVWSGDPAVTAHWCLAHYLLDGHHKVLAAARAQRPVTLLSFLAVDHSVAGPEEIDLALRALGAP